MTEFKLTGADNGFILEYDNPQPTRLVYEGNTGIPLALMNELLGDVKDAIDKKESDHIKITINVDKL